MSEQKIIVGRYYELSTGEVGMAKSAVNREYPFVIASWNFNEEGKNLSGACRLVREVHVTPVLPFELVAGQEYDLDNGEVVTLIEYSDESQVWRERMPFRVNGRHGYRHNVGRDGVLLHSQSSAPLVGRRIVAPHRKPSLSERLEKLRYVGSTAEFDAILAEVRKLEAKQ